MSKSYRIRTEIGKDKFLQVKLDQDYDKLELLSLAIFPNDVYTRDCAEFGVLCGRVFSNRGLGVENARVSIFIPLQSGDEQNPIISTLYPYKTFEQFNEDGYKYNLLPYTQSHSGHVPVGTFPERTDALTNKSVIEVYDKYYKFTAKTNSAGDYMIFGLPIGQHEMFMQVDLSDIGEFSLTPQDLIRSGRATESQIDGTNFKFSENYSELPQIVTLTKTIQIAPFYGQKEVCDYYITRADFDLTLEAFIEIQPTAVFMGSIISTQERRKLKQNCKVPPKQGWLCDLVTGRGMIETIRQTVNIGSDGRPILELFTLEKDGKVIDENGAWLVELPMNLDYVYTDEFGLRQISPDGSKGVPTKGKYRFKVKWNQSTFLSEENKRGYFLVPNIKEWGWADSATDPTPTSTLVSSPIELETDDSQKFIGYNSDYYVLEKLVNVQEYKIYSSLDDGETWVERPEFQTVIPFPDLSPDIQIKIVYTLVDSSNSGNPGYIYYAKYDISEFQQLGSYAFSLNWLEYGSTDMINEALNCEDRFYNFEYNKVYTVSSFLDRYTSKKISLYLPQRTIQIKNITDNSCEGNYNKFPTNDAYYRYDFLFIIISAILTFFKFVIIPLVVVLHFLAFIWPLIALILIIVNLIYGLIVLICEGINALTSLFNLSLNCPEWEWDSYSTNPFKNVKLPLLLHSEDGCSLCRCNIGDVDLNDNEYAAALARFIGQISIKNVSSLKDFTSLNAYSFMGNEAYYGILNSPLQFRYIDYAGGGEDFENRFYLGSFPAGYDGRDAYLQALGNGGLPIFSYGEGPPDDAGTVRFFDSFSIGASTQLPLGERVNLFNTKAKYFDRDPADTFRNPLNGGSISPGDIGWNQIKVKFFSDIPTNATTSHNDNIIVLIVDRTGITTGDLLTFQNPRDSEDPNAKKTLGKATIPDTFEVKYANPTYGEGNSSVYYNTQYIPPVGVVGDPIFTSGYTGTSCYSADLEYFQVIHTETLGGYRTKRANLQPTGNNRYSLAWRFLDSSHTKQSVGADYKTGYRGGNTQELDWVFNPMSSFPADAPINNPSDYFNNGMMFMRFMNPPRGPGYVGYNGWARRPVNCLQEMNYPILNYNIQVTRDEAGINTSAYLPEPNDPLFNTYWDPWYNLIVGTGDTPADTIVVFLVRGVDVHSGRRQVKYDLSRLYGYETYDQPGLQVEGSFFLNIPIQAWDDSNGSSPNRNGLKLPRHYDFYNNNPDLTNRGGAIFYRPYFWEYFTTSSPEVINDTDDEILPYDGAWKTTNHFYYSALDTFIPENGWALNGVGYTFGPSHSGNTPTYGPMNRDLFTDDIVVSDTANYFGVSWHRRTLGTTFDGSQLRVKNCGDLSTQLGSYHCGTGQPQPGFPRPNWEGGLSNKIYGTTYSQISSPFYSAYPINSGTDGNGVGCTTCDALYSGVRSKRIYCDPFFNVKTCTNEYGEGDGNFKSDISPVWWDRSVDDRNADWTNWYGIGDCYTISVQGWHTKYQYVFHGHRDNYEMNHVGGIFHGEYVEGGSIMTASFKRVAYDAAVNGDIEGQTDNNSSSWAQTHYIYGQWYTSSGGNNVSGVGGVTYNSDNYFMTNNFNNGEAIPGGRRGSWGDYTAWAPFNMKYYYDRYRSAYISPVYSNMLNARDPNNCYIALDSANVLGDYYHPQFIDMNYSNGLVFRSDRLPSSDRPNGYEEFEGSGFLIHQNPGFRMFLVSFGQDTACPAFSGFGGGSVAINPITNEPDNSLVQNSNVNDDVLQSTVDCTKAVDLNSYTIVTTSAGNTEPDILPQNPWSKKGKYLWFQRKEGCYNTVSRPILSMLADTFNDPNTGQQKTYSDLITVVEWVQRIKLTLAACFDIFSHTFSNNWINGTLYAFPFQLATRYDANNLPTKRDYCKDVLYFNETINNFFYRASPYKGSTSEFIGKDSEIDTTDTRTGGNIKNLLYPVTVMDLGPKNKYIQELVNSDVYDGYIADKIPSTTYQNIETFLNILILSRLISSSFIQLLIPSSSFAGGNEQEGNDDPSVGAFFQNRRWSNGRLFSIGPFNLPGLIDGDYAQMVSINSEIGILEFDPNNYSNSDVVIGIKGTGTLTDYPWFGVVLSGDNQWRDYISPRRKFYSENGDLSNLDQFSTQIPGVNFQTVPFYLWNDIFADSNSIFGHQNNNFVTNDPVFANIGYQESDRLFSRYFKPEDTYTKTHKGYIAKYAAITNVSGEVELTPDESVLSGSQIYTINDNGKIMVGAPFHFYFGLIKGSSAMDLFVNKYVDTTVVNG